VAAEREKRRRVRLFVALDLPAGVREEIVAWGSRELRDPALRAVAVENLHVTLAFLGHRDEEEVEPVAAAVTASAGAAPRMELGEPEARPGRGRPRVFALPVRSDGAVELQAELAGRLARGGLHEAEKRPFWPHVTVARVRSEKGRPLAVSKPPGALPGSLRKPFFGVRVALYRSELQPRGARYVPLAQVELSASGRQ
jgi:RNA 2',3'-cyclic 3'-phosphodiesterase